MKDMQTVEKYQQSQADKWAKKDKDIHLQVCFKKAVDVEIHLIQGAQALSEADPNDERKDLVVVSDEGKIELIEGTPQSQNPVEPPDLPADKHALAIITVPAGLTTVTATNIFDTRVPNTFAVNADKTKNELTVIKSQIVDLALADIEQNALLSLPSDIPFSNMIVEKFWDRNGLNNTVEVVDEGENMHGFYEAIDVTRCQVNVNGLPDITGLGGTGWSESTWRTRAYYWRGKIWTCPLDTLDRVDIRFISESSYYNHRSP